MREGQVGKIELVCLLCLCIISISVFGIPAQELYSNGNSSYISLPLATLLAYGLFLLLENRIRSGGYINLDDMLKCTIGNFFAQLFKVFIAIQFIFAAALPLIQFMETMHSYIFDTSYVMIAFYITIPIVVLPWLGFESIARTARIFAPLLLILSIIMMFIPLNSYQSYRMYPLLGDGVGDISLRTSAFCGMLFLIMISLFYIPQCTHGTRYYRKAVSKAVLISIIIMASMEIAISMIYTSNQLMDIQLPFLNLNDIIPAETYSIRSEKVTLFFLISGCFISSGFSNYMASNLLTKLFKQNDIRSFAFSCGFIASCIALIACITRDITIYNEKFVLYTRCISLAITLLILIIASLIKKKGTNKEKRERAIINE